MMRRVVITGLGVVSPVGKNPQEFFANLMAGRSGIRRLQTPFLDKLRVRIGAPVNDFNAHEHFTELEVARVGRFSQFALIAAEQAVRDSQLEIGEAERARAGVYMGSCQGGLNTLEEAYLDLLLRDKKHVNPNSVLLSMNNAAASQVSLKYKLQGPNITYATACSSSAIAIGEAYQQIKYGLADIMLAGGAEALLTTLISVKAWEAMRALAEEDPVSPAASCKPFAKNRSGLVLGEGAAVLVLEEEGRAIKRGARIYAELVGYDCSSDSVHITKPDAEGQARTMRNALHAARLQPEDIGYINAHGTGTLVGDIEETKAIKQAFGAHAAKVPISSTKSMHGHMMGATAAAEFVAAVLSLQHNSVPPTINLRDPDPECELDYVPNEGRVGLRMEAVMSNSFAFGGSNAVLIAKRYA